MEMLQNTLYKLRHDGKLTIGFFGGSITEGAGASDASKTSWRGAVFNWFVANYPDCELTSIQAAIGGTGSSLGIFRCERDLLSKKPDLVFIEFSVNDGFGDYNETLANSETIVRKIYAANPFADIVYVHTTTRDISDRLAKGGDFIARSAHSAVMYRYSIPQIDMGEILRDIVIASGGDWSVLTRDGCHPNDEGYAIYTKAVVEFLEARFSVEPPEMPEPVKLPVRISTSDRIEARLEDSFDAFDKTVEDGWHKVDKPLCGRYGHYIEASEVGAEFVFEFTGSRIGLYLMLAKDSGDLIYRIDDGEEKTLRTWDKYCKSFNRAGGMLLGSCLEYGSHRLTLRVADTKAEESEGTVIRIGAFMVY